MSYVMPLVERYRVTRFAHIERRQDAFNQDCNVINDVTGKVHASYHTMEAAKHSLCELDLTPDKSFWKEGDRD